MRHEGWEVRLTVDRTGNVYGSNKNRTKVLCSIVIQIIIAIAPAHSPLT